jgi:succinate-semialdehyde dehydrogenase/glutarate-semialdehyde dehydrogenase/succinyl-CoA reductase
LTNSAAELITINPTTEEILNKYTIMTKENVSAVVKKARDAYKEWMKDLEKRIDSLYHVAQELRKNKENLSRTATNEMGKAIKEARAEIDKCVWAIEYFADNGKNFIHDESFNTDARKSIIKFEALGVIASIMPWNFPYWQALRFAAPSLIAGNTIVLKPASATMQCGIEIEKTFDKAGLSEGIFKTVIGDSSVAEILVDSDVNAVTFTGSVPVGAKVAQRATSQLKKTVLELGGSDPFIVCADADIEKASTGAVKGRFINCGQSCIASKRFIVVKNIANEFIEKFIQKTEKLKVGDPSSDDTDLGPLVNAKALKTIESQVNDSIKEGAEVLTGGEQKVGSKGYFYKPTILGNITPNMRIVNEEVFGPVAPILIAENEKEAIKLANDSEFGLGASIWTQDLENAEVLSSIIKSGIVSVNNKKSGFGRELSRYGMLEFVNIKSIRLYDQLIHEHYVE